MENGYWFSADSKITTKNRVITKHGRAHKDTVVYAAICRALHTFMAIKKTETTHCDWISAHIQSAWATGENVRRWLDMSRRCEQAGTATDLRHASRFAAASSTKAERTLIPCWRPMCWTMCWAFWTKAKVTANRVVCFFKKGLSSSTQKILSFQRETCR